MWEEIKKFVVQLFDDLTAWAYDVLVGAIELILDVVAGVIEAIEVPEFIATTSIAGYLPESILYFLVMSKFGEALTLVGLGYGFRILRRFLTFGIW